MAKLITTVTIKTYHLELSEKEMVYLESLLEHPPEGTTEDNEEFRVRRGLFEEINKAIL